MNMERTLYLSEKHGVEIRRDGPSLWVRERGKAGYRVPARLVGRVVIMGNIRMDAGVISLFTEENIPVAFLNRQGRELAVCMPYNHRLARHYEEQKVLFRTEEHAKLFTQWLLAVRRSNQLETLKYLSDDKARVFSKIGFRERDYEDIVKSLLFDGDQQWRAARTVVEGLFHEMIIRSLLRADLDPHFGITNRRHNFALALEFAWALGGEIDLQTIRFLNAAHYTGVSWRSTDGSIILKEGLKAVIERFEKRKKTVDRLIEAMIDDLFRLIREIGMGVYEEDSGR
ncbi:MAG: CRISPR-associated endonuclease Cas1 [Syntrophorhabdales bacterium]